MYLTANHIFAIDILSNAKNENYLIFTLFFLHLIDKFEFLGYSMFTLN